MKTEEIKINISEGEGRISFARRMGALFNTVNTISPKRIVSWNLSVEEAIFTVDVGEGFKKKLNKRLGVTNAEDNANFLYEQGDNPERDTL